VCVCDGDLVNEIRQVTWTLFWHGCSSVGRSLFSLHTSGAEFLQVFDFVCVWFCVCVCVMYQFIGKVWFSMQEACLCFSIWRCSL